MMFKTLFFIALASAAFVGARGQELRWRPALPVNVGSYNYEFTALDCWNNVCTVASIRKNLDSVGTNNYSMLLFFRSNDGGESWMQQDPGLPHSDVDNNNYIRQVQQIDSLHAVAMSDSGVVIVTSDGGNTWVRRDLPVKWDQREFHFSDSLTGIVTLWSDLADNIYTTSDAGLTWNRSPWSPYLPATMCHSDGGERFRAITLGNGPLYYTSDDWNTVDSTGLIVPHGGPGDTEAVIGCNFHGDTLVAYGYRRSQQGPIIFFSKDNGVHWANVPLPKTTISVINSVTSLAREAIFAAGNGNDRHVFRSINHGVSWSLDTMIYSSDTTRDDVASIAETTGGNTIAILSLLFPPIGTELMVGEPLGEGVQSKPVVSNPIEIYPNPSTQCVTVESLDAGSRVTIRDILGRQVLRGVIPASGRLSMDISSLHPGIYYASDGISQTKFVKQ